MATLTEIVAAVAVHSSAAALSHFGVTAAPSQLLQAPPPAERVVARSPRTPEKPTPKLVVCTRPHAAARSVHV